MNRFYQWKDFGAVAAFAHVSGFVVAQVVETDIGWRVWVRQSKELKIVGIKSTKDEAMSLAERKLV